MERGELAELLVLGKVSISCVFPIFTSSDHQKKHQKKLEVLEIPRSMGGIIKYLDLPNM